MFASVIQKKIFSFSFDFDRGITILNDWTAIVIENKISKKKAFSIYIHSENISKLCYGNT